MKCQCGVAFCWLCGKQIEDSLFPSHFQWWNPSGCSNLQVRLIPVCPCVHLRWLCIQLGSGLGC
jgi:hypothetical protein